MTYAHNRRLSQTTPTHFRNRHPN